MDVEGNHHRAEDGDYGEAGQDAAPHEVLENQGAEASITYVTGLNVAATSMGLVSRSRGTKFGVRKSSGKKTSPPELEALRSLILQDLVWSRILPGFAMVAVLGAVMVALNIRLIRHYD